MSPDGPSPLLTEAVEIDASARHIDTILNQVNVMSAETVVLVDIKNSSDLKVNLRPAQQGVCCLKTIFIREDVEILIASSPSSLFGAMGKSTSCQNMRLDSDQICLPDAAFFCTAVQLFPRGVFRGRGRRAMAAPTWNGSAPGAQLSDRATLLFMKRESETEEDQCCQP